MRVTALLFFMAFMLSAGVDAQQVDIYAGLRSIYDEALKAVPDVTVGYGPVKVSAFTDGETVIVLGGLSVARYAQGDWGSAQFGINGGFEVGMGLSGVSVAGMVGVSTYIELPAFAGVISLESLVKLPHAVPVFSLTVSLDTGKVIDFIKSAIRQ